MWGNCQAHFTSLSDLVGHVNLEHLRLPPAPALDAVSEVQPDNSPLSCLWRDCTIYSTPQSIPTSSSNHSGESLLNVLQSHLLHDHLGQHLLPTIPANEPSAFLSTQTNLNQQRWNKDSSLLAERSVSPVMPSSHECSGTHKCNWKGCGQSFTTCSGLTSHIAAVHVGGGKAHYECYWEGCSRNGSNGFSSKQKISRHLQASLMATGAMYLIFNYFIQSHTQDIVLINVRFAFRISPKLQHCNNTCAATRKRVSRLAYRLNVIFIMFYLRRTLQM